MSPSQLSQNNENHLASPNHLPLSSLQSASSTSGDDPSFLEHKANMNITNAIQDGFSSRVNNDLPSRVNPPPTFRVPTLPLRKELTKPIGLFKLPVELRGIIFGMVFATNSVTPNASPCSDDKTIIIAQRVTTDQLRKRYHIQSFTHDQLNIMLVCRQLRAEATAFFESSMRFRFLHTRAMTRFCGFHFPDPENIRLGQINGAVLRKVELIVERCCGKRELNGVFEILVKKAPRLQDLVAGYHAPVDGKGCSCNDCVALQQQWEDFWAVENKSRAVAEGEKSDLKVGFWKKEAMGKTRGRWSSMPPLFF